MFENVQRCLFLLWEWSSFEGCPKIWKSLGGPQNYKQNDLRNADYSQSKNKHLWTSFKDPNETTWTFLGEIFLVLGGGLFWHLVRKFFLWVWRLPNGSKYTRYWSQDKNKPCWTQIKHSRVIPRPLLDGKKFYVWGGFSDHPLTT